MSSNSTPETDRPVPYRFADASPQDPRPGSRLEHVVVENDGAPDECAIVPESVSESERNTTWITAQEGSYVDLDETR